MFHNVLKEVEEIVITSVTSHHEGSVKLKIEKNEKDLLKMNMMAYSICACSMIH